MISTLDLVFGGCLKTDPGLVMVALAAAVAAAGEMVDCCCGLGCDDFGFGGFNSS